MTPHTLNDVSRWSRYVPMALLAGLLVSGFFVVREWVGTLSLP